MPEDQVSLDWQQGSILPSELLPEGERRGNTLAIVISQSCDIVHLSFEVEPFVEVVLAVKSARLDGNYTFGKSPRRVDFKLVAIDSEQSYSCDINRRLRLDRRSLLDNRPLFDLPEEETQLLARWLSRRYYRVALPDALVKRVGDPKMSQIRKALKRDGIPLSNILVSLDHWDEVGEDTPYKVILFGVVPVEVQKHPDQFEQASRAIAAVRAILSNVAGVVLEDSQVVGEDKISMDDLRTLRHWEFDSLSLAIDPVEY